MLRDPTTGYTTPGEAARFVRWHARLGVNIFNVALCGAAPGLARAIDEAAREEGARVTAVDLCHAFGSPGAYGGTIKPV